MKGAFEKNTKGFQFVRKNKPTPQQTEEGGVSRTRLATSAKVTAKTTRSSRRSSLARGRSARRSLLEWEQNPADFLVQFHEDVPPSESPTARLGSIVTSCVEYALRNANATDIQDAGWHTMIDTFSGMYTAQLQEGNVLRKLTNEEGADEGVDSEQMSDKELELNRQISAYKVALSKLENETQEWAALEKEYTDKGKDNTIAEATPSAWQEAFSAGRLGVSALPEHALAACQQLLLQVDELHRNVIAINRESKEFNDRLDQHADAILQGSATDMLNPGTPRQTIQNILVPPRPPTASHGV